jgi:hypothetical protein
VPKKDAHSVMSFCHFLKAFKAGNKISPAILPTTDAAFYRKTMERLIEAGELPEHAQEHFDEAFTVPLLRSLVDFY